MTTKDGKGKTQELQYATNSCVFRPKTKTDGKRRSYSMTNSCVFRLWFSATYWCTA